jgi:hypothetical protein
MGPLLALASLIGLAYPFLRQRTTMRVVAS